MQTASSTSTSLSERGANIVGNWLRSMLFGNAGFTSASVKMCARGQKVWLTAAWRQSTKAKKTPTKTPRSGTARVVPHFSCALAAPDGGRGYSTAGGRMRTHNNPIL